MVGADNYPLVRELVVRRVLPPFVTPASCLLAFALSLDANDLIAEEDVDHHHGLMMLATKYSMMTTERRK